MKSGKETLFGRQQLKAVAQAAGLRLTRADLEQLLPAWRRYEALVAELRDDLAAENPPA